MKDWKRVHAVRTLDGRIDLALEHMREHGRFGTFVVDATDDMRMERRWGRAVIATDGHELHWIRTERPA